VAEVSSGRVVEREEEETRKRFLVGGVDKIVGSMIGEICYELHYALQFFNLIKELRESKREAYDFFF